MSQTQRRIPRRTLALGLAFALALPLPLLPLADGALAQEPTAPSGREVVDRVNARDEGEVLRRNVTMRLRDKRGHERVRETVFLRRFFGAEKRMAIFYESPRNVAGTAFLTWDHPEADRDDDQWLYLPALRRSRRISASDRGDYFLGTDLTYEDIKNETRVSADDYTWRTLGEEEVDGHPCLRVEGTPVDERISRELGYSKLELYVDAESFIVRRAEYWDRAERHLKSSRVRDIRVVDDILTPHRIEVSNHRTGHATIFEISAVDYATPIDESVFTESAIRRGTPP